MNLDCVKDYRVLVVGDAIYDRYCFVDTLGRGTKEPIISVKFKREETYQGGVWASANHIRDLCATVDIWHGATGTINTKYVGPYNQKLFSVHSDTDIKDSQTPAEVENYDVVIVFDYGLGFLTNGLRQHIMDKAKWLAVNAQSNSSNYGFNRVNEKWPRADLCVVDELEARLAAHEADGPIEDVILKLPYKRTIVTMGSQGAVGYANREFYRETALTERPVDLLGAGDAVLAVVAPYARAGFSLRQLIHLGNIAGAIKVGTLGHRTHITKSALEKYL